MDHPRHHRLHRSIRALSSNYLLPFGDDWVSRGLDWVFDRDRPNWILAPGRGQWPTMVLDLSHTLQRKFYYFPKLHGRYYGKLPFRRFLVDRLAPGATFLDIGSNVGFFSLLAAQRVGPAGKVYAFEPDPAIHESLTRSAAANQFAHLEAFCVALSDRHEESTFYRARDGTASSLVPEAPGREHRYSGQIVAQVTTLDRLASAGKIAADKIALLKVDVEGEEARVIAGMRETLRAASYPPIWCEVRGPEGSTRAPNTFEAVCDQLSPLGYAPFRWTPEGRQPATGVSKRADILFERQS